MPPVVSLSRTTVLAGLASGTSDITVSPDLLFVTHYLRHAVARKAAQYVKLRSSEMKREALRVIDNILFTLSQARRHWFDFCVDRACDAGQHCVANIGW